MAFSSAWPEEPMRALSLWEHLTYEPFQVPLLTQPSRVSLPLQPQPSPHPGGKRGEGTAKSNLCFPPEFAEKCFCNHFLLYCLSKYWWMIHSLIHWVLALCSCSACFRWQPSCSFPSSLLSHTHLPSTCCLYSSVSTQPWGRQARKLGQACDVDDYCGRTVVAQCWGGASPSLGWGGIWVGFKNERT